MSFLRIELIFDAREHGAESQGGHQDRWRAAPQPRFKI